LATPQQVMIPWKLKTCFLMQRLSASWVFERVHCWAGKCQESPLSGMRTVPPSSYIDQNNIKGSSITTIMSVLICCTWRPKKLKSKLWMIEQSMLVCTSEILHQLPAHISIPESVSTAHVHLLRQPCTSLPLFAYPHMPTFEKSNVLVIYDNRHLHFWPILIHAASLVEVQLAPVCKFHSVIKG
jgi:hypothetical protein